MILTKRKLCVTCVIQLIIYAKTVQLLSSSSSSSIKRFLKEVSIIIIIFNYYCQITIIVAY